MDYRLPLGNIHDFSSEEARQLLHNKFVVVLGDSIFRSVYKDLVCILQTDKMLTLSQLKNKGEETCANDHLVEFQGLYCGTDYCEVRQYRTDHHLVRFYFITRVHSAYMESILSDFQKGVETGLAPDVLLIASCLWDLNRYHDKVPKEPPISKAIREYRQNLEKFFEKLSDLLPSSCLIIWTTATPLQRNHYGSIFKGNVKNSSPEDVIEANFYSACLASCHMLDVLDLHFSLRFLEHHHYKDGVHWDNWVHRCITKRLLTHMAEAWGVELDKRMLDPGAAPVPQEHAGPWHSTPRHPCFRASRPPLPWASPSPGPHFLQRAGDALCNGPAKAYGDEAGPPPQLNGLHPYGEARPECGTWEALAPHYGDGFSEPFEGPWAESEPHCGPPSSVRDSRFQQDEGYSDSAVESYEYCQSPWVGPSIPPPCPPWGSHGPAEGWDSSCGPQLAQPGSSDFASGRENFDGGRYEPMFPSSPMPPFLSNGAAPPHGDGSGPWSVDEFDFDYDTPYPGYPVPRNATFPPYNGWRGPGPADSIYGGHQGVWPPPDEMGHGDFPPPRPLDFDAPPPPFHPFDGPPRRGWGARNPRVMRGRGVSRSRRPYRKRRKRPQHPS